MYQVLNCDGVEHLESAPYLYNTVFADPPDNIGLGYDQYKDKQAESDYKSFLRRLLRACAASSWTTYISLNACWITAMAVHADELQQSFEESIKIRWLVQGFTFGEHNKHDLANNFRPILRVRWEDAPLFPNACRVESWRMKNGDKRANPDGRVPGDVWFQDFLEYARVTGNSKQRRSWHPTQLHEGLVEDCLMMSTPKGGLVCDPFAGTGTTLRVCKKNGWACTTCDISEEYCKKIREEHQL